MSTSNINDIFFLSSYTSSARGNSTAKYTPGVYASSSKKANSSDGFVTVAVQGDGVHVLDVSALHPIISHTLGPSTSFACPPLTLPSSSHSSRTYAVISSSPELSSPEEAGRTLWMWQDDISNSKQKEKRSNLIFSKNEIVYGLYTCDESERIVALSTTGNVTVIDADSLEVKTTFSSSPSTVSHASVFPASTSPLSSGQNTAILVMVASGSSKTTHLRILAMDETDSISLKQESEISVDSEKIASVSCSRTGVLSILTTDGLWNSYQLSSETSLEQLSPPLHLSGFSFLSEPSKPSVSLLALTSSHVLLAAVASREITLLLWDLQFSVLLSSHTFSVPSALSSSTLHIHLVPGVDSPTKSGTQVIGQAILILSSIPPKEKSDGHKIVSVLVVVPYTVPVVSTIAAAMGRGEAGKKWLRSPEEEKEKGTEEKARSKLLDTMWSAMQSGQSQAASAAFMKWAPKNDECQTATSDLDYNFVKEVLTIVLGLPSESKTNPIPAGAGSYTPEVVRYLLERNVACSNMVSTSSGLLGALRARDDWTSIELAFTTVLDLTESEIVECLHAVVRHHRLTTSASKSQDAMQVDTPAPTPNTNTSIPSLPSFLNLITSYATSRAPLVLAFRKHMRDAEDLTATLQVLDGWVAKKVKMDERLLPGKKDLKKNEQGVWVIVGRRGDKDKTEDMPSLGKIADFLQVILDACFLPLLQHPPAHKILRKLQEKMAPEITFSAVVESLRGPLEPFAIAQEKAVKESLISPQERQREKQKGDWRQRRKGVNVAADIGLYKLEELVL